MGAIFCAAFSRDPASRIFLSSLTPQVASHCITKLPPRKTKKRKVLNALLIVTMKLTSIALLQAASLLVLVSGQSSWKEVCSTTFDGLVSCSVNEQSQAEASHCNDCVINEIESNMEHEGTCLTLEDELCVSIRRCSDPCGTCSDEMEEMIRCMWDVSQPQCDDLVCDQIFKDYRASVISGSVVGALFIVVIAIRLRRIFMPRNTWQDGGTELSTVGHGSGTGVV